MLASLTIVLFSIAYQHGKSNVWTETSLFKSIVVEQKQNVDYIPV